MLKDNIEYFETQILPQLLAIQQKYSSKYKQEHQEIKHLSDQYNTKKLKLVEKYSKDSDAHPDNILSKL